MNKTTWSGVAVSIMLLASGARAQAYLGLSAGPGKFSLSCEGVFVTYCDNSSPGAKAFAGYAFHADLAAEWVYLNFGKERSSSLSPTFWSSGQSKATAVGLGLAYSPEIAPKVPLTLRFGVARTKQEISGFSRFPGSFDVVRSSNQFYGGLSVGYRVSRIVTVNAAYDFSRVGAVLGSYTAVHLTSLGLSLSF